MESNFRERVCDRARNLCEYCQIPESFFFRHQLEHIIARKHAGKTELGNLPWACINCNLHKGPNLSGIDPETRVMTRIFRPRQDTWEDHFEWHGAKLVGLTDVGRTTIHVLNINEATRLRHRERLMREGRSDNSEAFEREAFLDDDCGSAFSEINEHRRLVQTRPMKIFRLRRQTAFSTSHVLYHESCRRL